MNIDPARITVTVLARYIVVIICSKIGLEKAETERLLDPEVLFWLGTGALTMVYGLYATLRSKLKQNIARALPSGTPAEAVKEIASAQPLSAVLSTKPTIGAAGV